MNSSEKKEVKRLAPPIETVTLLDIEGILGRMMVMFEEAKPEGIVEPLHPVEVTAEAKIVRPPVPDKLWFGVTIVKVDPVKLNIIINTGKSSTTPYIMGVDEKVYTQNFSRPCIYDVMLWTDKGKCTVKVRGSR